MPRPKPDAGVRRPVDVADAAVQPDPCNTFDRDVQAGTGRWKLVDAATQYVHAERREMEVQTEERDDGAFASLALVRSFAAQPSTALTVPTADGAPSCVSEMEIETLTPTSLAAGVRDEELGAVALDR